MNTAVSSHKKTDVSIFDWRCTHVDDVPHHTHETCVICLSLLTAVQPSHSCILPVVETNYHIKYEYRYYCTVPIHPPSLVSLFRTPVAKNCSTTLLRPLVLAGCPLQVTSVVPATAMFLGHTAQLALRVRHRTRKQHTMLQPPRPYSRPTCHRGAQGRARVLHYSNSRMARRSSRQPRERRVFLSKV